MIEKLIIGLGVAAVLEGAVLALAPNRLEDLIKIIASIKLETRRWMGLSIASFGMLIIWLTTLG